MNNFDQYLKSHGLRAEEITITWRNFRKPQKFFEKVCGKTLVKVQTVIFKDIPIVEDALGIYPNIKTKTLVIK